jgi:cell division protein FtsN
VIRDLGGGIEKKPAPASELAGTPLPPVEKESSSRNIRFYLVSLILLIALAVISLAIRGFFREKPIHENVPQLTELTPPAETDAPVEESPQPVTATEPAPQQPAAQKPATEKAPPQEPVQKRPLALKNRVYKTAVLKGGKSLYSLAIKYYGKANPTMYDLILSANAGITDIRSIPDNRKIRLPEITPESFIQETGGSYSLFIGTFETSSQASACAAKLSSLGKNTLIQARKFSPKETWYRLTAGSFATRDEALDAVNLLIKQGVIFIPGQLS